MKRKIVLTAAVMLFCVGIVMFAKGFQKEAPSNPEIIKNNSKIVVNNEQVSEQNKQKDDNNSKVENSTAKTTNSKKNAEKSTAIDNSVPNFKITDNISGKVILSVKVDFQNKTVADITINTLNSKNIIYRATGFGDMTYFSMIDNLSERQNGPESGWCYFINGKEYNVGAGSYKPANGDIIEWKYLKDGLSS